MRIGNFLALLSVFLALPLIGCSVVQKEYVAADRATYEAIAPEYLKYVDADPALDEDQKGRRHRLVESWDARTTAGENK